MTLPEAAATARLAFAATTGKRTDRIQIAFHLLLRKALSVAEEPSRGVGKELHWDEIGVKTVQPVGSLPPINPGPRLAKLSFPWLSP